MEERVTYADLRFPPTPDLVQQQMSCTHDLWSMEKSPSYGQQTLRAQCQFCPVGWLWDAGQCYYFSSAKKTWEKSREDCCSRGAQLVTIQDNTTLAFLMRTTTNMEVFHVGLKKDGFASDWKWLDGTTLKGIFLIHRYTRSYQACGRLSGLGLSGGLCSEPLGWVCKQSAATLQWLQSSPPSFIWGNTTYSCVRP
ncbi:killer cell lectin-like receptor subfamily G member 1 isoform X2 [Corapipo altera]|uniref:killer cell lectin-like receptor subfamily G member 1 isoform X2 n=1 Tax=Corapipo altera TaxID=415028 RepID=UPI000FD66574|nr:killer cell lectin-like receptor subfamily G member 1 isoform X2 [Corapipo altera]